MEFIDDKGIITYFAEKEEVNYIASCISPWHAIGVESAIIRLNQKGINVRGIILVNPHQNKYIISESNFSEATQSCCSIYKYQRNNPVLAKDIIKYLIKGYKSKDYFRRHIYLVGNMVPNIHLSALLYNALDCKIISIISDEGIGSYTLDSKFSIKWALTEKKSLSAVKKLKLVIKELACNYALYKYVMSWQENRYETLFTKKKGILIKNEDVVDSYKIALRQSAKCIIGKFGFYSNSVVIATQAYVEDGLASYDEYMAVIGSVISYYKEKGNKIILRIHPRETEEKYLQFDCEIDKTSYSLETILASLDALPEAIVAFNSTVLVTARLFWDIKAVTLGNMLIESSKTLPKTNRENIIRFMRLFRDYISEFGGEVTK